jgi:hypothetical protein
LVLLDALDLDQRREQFADLVGQVGAAVDVLLQAGPLAAPEPRGELLGQLVEPPVIGGTRVRGHRSDPLPSTRHRSQDRLEPFEGAEIPLRPGFLTDPQHFGRLGAAELLEVSQSQDLAVDRVELLRRASWMRRALGRWAPGWATCAPERRGQRRGAGLGQRPR